MQKDFNITGTCYPNEHYIADVSGKLTSTLELVNKGRYFIVNRPRQYGKTTTLHTIARVLRQTGEYVVFNTSFEGLGEATFEDESQFSPVFISLLLAQAKVHHAELCDFLTQQIKEVSNLNTLGDAITKIALQTPKKVVVLVDEVDKSSNHILFINFLAMLRNKYLVRQDSKTFFSIVLAGVHDVKSLKSKIRPDSEQQFNSPWNIAAEYTVDMNLYPHEIKPMLEEYAADRGVTVDTQAIADRLFYYTSGYPFLVSKLCKMFDETYLPQKSEKVWTIEDVDIAARRLVRETNTNFDTQVKNLENNPELYELIYDVIIDNQKRIFSIHNPVVNFAAMYGLIVDKNGSVAIHNRIYSEVLSDYMSSKIEGRQSSKNPNNGWNYKNDDDTLNMESVFLSFQAFMKKEYSRKDRDFLEKNGRLVFLAFLKPIINGSGHDFKEPQISEEQRLDIVVTYLHQKFVAELKVWRGEKMHQKGLQQLSDYLDTMSLTEGYLLIFDHSEVKSWHSEWIEFGNKKIFVAWV